MKDAIAERLARSITKIARNAGLLDELGRLPDGSVPAEFVAGSAYVNWEGLGEIDPGFVGRVEQAFEAHTGTVDHFSRRTELAQDKANHPGHSVRRGDAERDIIRGPGRYSG